MTYVSDLHHEMFIDTCLLYLKSVGSFSSVAEIFALSFS